jgi:hypothetical protein
MQLIVSGLDGAQPTFRHLWGRYIVGFRPWKHCIACFESKVESAIKPGMADGTYPLRDDLDLFYLCAVGQPETKKAGEDFKRKFTNVHLAVRPRRGSVAAIGSVYGATFVIKDAEAIPIQQLRPEEFPHLPEKHLRCKNFQFGYQTFAADLVGAAAPKEVVRKLRHSS